MYGRLLKPAIEGSLVGRIWNRPWLLFVCRITLGDSPARRRRTLRSARSKQATNLGQKMANSRLGGCLFHDVTLPVQKGFISSCILTGLDVFFVTTVYIGYRSGLESGDGFCLSTISPVVAEPAGCSNMDQYLVHVDASIRSIDADIAEVVGRFATCPNGTVFRRAA